MKHIILAPLLIMAAIAATTPGCGTVDQGLDDVGGTVGVSFGHVWDCALEIQIGYPTAVSFEYVEYHPCLEPGDAARDAWLNAWIDEKCWPEIDKYIQTGEVTGGDCLGHPGCDAQNWNICTP